jgi:hypothetical protein
MNGPGYSLTSLFRLLSLLSRALIWKGTLQPPEKETKDLNSVVKLVKKLSNEVVDLKKNVGEGISRPRPFRPFFKRIDNFRKPPEVPQITLNLDKFGMDNFYSYHQQNHSEKTCYQ